MALNKAMARERFLLALVWGKISSELAAYEAALQAAGLMSSLMMWLKMEHQQGVLMWY